MARHSAAPVAAPGFFVSVLKPIFISLVVTFLALCFLAAAITWGPVTEGAADTSILLATIFCILLTGFLSARQKAGRGFMLGGLGGLLYVAVAYTIAALVFGSFSIGAGTMRLFALGLIFGALGGIIGVNIGRKRR